MKKILIAASAALMVASCGDLTSLNQNTKAPEKVPAGTLIANATVSMMDYLSNVNVNVNNFTLWSQHWTQSTYVDESNFDYNNRDVNGNTFDAMYATVLRDLSDARAIIASDAGLDAATAAQQNAVIDVLEVYAYSTLVDIFDDVPYSEAIGESLAPAYDGAATIYGALGDRLAASIGVLMAGSDNGLGSYDLIYGGSSAGWAKFAASLGLRLSIRMADVSPATAQAGAEAAIAAGVITLASESAALNYTSSPPHTNPYWDDLVQSGRKDFVAANTIADVMNMYADPRRSAYFKNLSNDSVIGAAYGLQSSYNLHSQPGTALENASRPAMFLDNVEVGFLLADAASRGWSVGGLTAASLYDAAVAESILAWGGTATDAATYLAQTGVTYDAANWKTILGTQKWLAMYSRGNEAWSTQRMYDAPAMNIAHEAQRITPLRMSYGIDEYSLNTSNVTAARGGNDDDTSPIFWDVN
ncbi:MAG: SusD/RagB family nutrient-binding outer membrane lipoprotein [Schleiferiaceae bacterium]|nr:SusD/RagB family nutrient-binding outer membrane lipoprotein [Schleiferiaceae bacterium]MDO7592969.1 SusD/RagB family nutrient-binding outer membrane lipoprotein [Schleiferiaceae bacterium]